MATTRHVSGRPAADQPHPCSCSGDVFEMRFSATPRGARLARRLTSHRVHEWGHPYGSQLNDVAALVVAELATNAVTHGLVPGRDFLLRLVHTAGRLRVEIGDARGERLPRVPESPPGEDAEAGRGLMLVAALAEEWGVSPRKGAPGKTVWAVLGEIT
jgi:anti-sigma regulatory factor (Ser/Thr protein kinase)